MDNMESNEELRECLQEAVPIMLGSILKSMEESGELGLYERRAQLAGSNGHLVINGGAAATAQGNEAEKDDVEGISIEIPDPEDVIRYYKTISRIPLAEQCLGDMIQICHGILEELRPHDDMQLGDCAVDFFRHTMEIELARTFKVADQLRTAGGCTAIAPKHVRAALQMMGYQHSEEDGQ